MYASYHYYYYYHNIHIVCHCEFGMTSWQAVGVCWTRVLFEKRTGREKMECEYSAAQFPSPIHLASPVYKYNKKKCICKEHDLSFHLYECECIKNEVVIPKVIYIVRLPACG